MGKCDWSFINKESCTTSKCSKHSKTVNVVKHSKHSKCRKVENILLATTLLDSYI